MRGHIVKQPFVELVKALAPRTLLIICGLPASFKSRIAEEISKTTGYVILRSDLIRLEVFKGEDIFDVKLAGNMNKRLFVYEEMFRQADCLMKKSDKGVILDATFVTQELRRRAAEIALKNNLMFVILETVCPEEVSLEIIRHRTKEKYVSNAVTEEVYFANKAQFEPIDVDDLKERYAQLKVEYLAVYACNDNQDSWSVANEKE